jgi:hypothetical protein
MKVLRKIVGKTKIDKIRSQQVRESCGIQPIEEWVERRTRREWEQHATKMDAEITVGRRSPAKKRNKKIFKLQI